MPNPAGAARGATLLKRFSPLAIVRFLYHLPKFARLYWALLLDARVSPVLKTVFLAGVGYALSPIDLIPGWVYPFIGYVDDIVIFVATSRFFIKNAPEEVVLEHLERIAGDG